LVARSPERNVPRDRNATLDQFVGGRSDDARNGASEGESEGKDAGESEDKDANTDTDIAADGDADADRSEDAEAEAEAGAREAEAEAGAREADTAVEPAEPTYRFAPAGEACGACGERVERLWRAAGERRGILVCRTCKDWERG
jgi:hypothetical protein